MSLVLNGSTQYAQILEALAAGRPLTIAGWFKSDTDDSLRGIASIADKDNDVNYRALALFGTVAGDPVVANERDSGNNTWSETTSGYSTGSWQHGLAEFINASSRKSLIDGGNEGEETTSVSPASLDRTAVGVLCRSSLAWFFSGKLAEIALWDMILSAQNKTDLAGTTNPTTIESGNLLAYYRLYENANDGSGNGKHLTLVGSPSFDSGDHPTVDAPAGGSFVAANVEYYYRHLMRSLTC